MVIDNLHDISCYFPWSIDSYGGWFIDIPVTKDEDTRDPQLQLYTGQTDIIAGCHSNTVSEAWVNQVCGCTM